MNIIINDQKTCVSDENEELFNELVNRIINETVSGESGKADFDIESPHVNSTHNAALFIKYEIKTDDPKDMDDYNGFTEPMDDIDGSKEPIDL